jgi:serine/threonine-protein kinase HipA
VTNQLNVQVNQQLSGSLLREHGEFIFNYAQTQPENFVSLTMPVRVKSFVQPKLHPIFEMHLPEGYLLSVIKKHFSKLTDTDDFGLLQLLAPSIRGRINYDTEAFNTTPLKLGYC